MRVIRTAHKYELASFDGGLSQDIQFIEKAATEDGRFITVIDGTTNEEVLAVLIDRMQELQAKCWCRENAIVITKLEESLTWLNKRTADRQARGVEGKPVQ